MNSPDVTVAMHEATKTVYNAKTRNLRSKCIQQTLSVTITRCRIADIQVAFTWAPTDRLWKLHDSHWRLH